MRLIVVICLSTLTALAQSPGAQRINHDQAVRDTRTFINLLEDTHPDPYTAYGGASSSAARRKRSCRSCRKRGS